MTLRPINRSRLVINPHRSKRFVVRVALNNTFYKLFQIIFHVDGSIFVNFPYLTYSEGIVSRMRLPRGTNRPSDASFLDHGKVTSHLVKYAHHTDGRAHFSQDGLVHTTIKKQSVPLINSVGHIFTATIHGITDFQSTSKESRVSKKRASVDFVSTGTHLAHVKFTGWWYSHDELKRRAAGPLQSTIIGPTYVAESPSGEKHPAFLLSPLTNTPHQDYSLLLLGYIQHEFSGEETGFTFIGGFDMPDRINDLSQDTEFLGMLYPVSDMEDLKERIGSIDLSLNAP